MIGPRPGRPGGRRRSPPTPPGSSASTGARSTAGPRGSSTRSTPGRSRSRTGRAALAALAGRSRDGRPNAVQSIGHWRYGHRALQGAKCRGGGAARLDADGVGLDTWPARHVDGIAIERRGTIRAFTADELAGLPPRHQARADPGLTFARTDLVAVAPPAYHDRDLAGPRVFAIRDGPPDDAVRAEGEPDR